MAVSYNPRIGTVSKTSRSGEKGDLWIMRFHAMGTQCEIQFLADSEELRKVYLKEVIAWVTEFENKYSRYLPDSLVTKINQSAGKSSVEIDPETHELLSVCNGLYYMSDGLIDASILPLLKLWDYKRKHVQMPTEAEREAAMQKVGWPEVIWDETMVYLPEEGMGLDFGGFGKEYAVDKIASLSRSLGIKDFLIDFGHDISVAGSPPDMPFWHIGLEDPAQPGTARMSVILQDRSIAGSGDYWRYFEYKGKRYSHIINPLNGCPIIETGTCVHVIAQTCLQAGLLATSTLIKEEGLSLIEQTFDVEGCLMTQSRSQFTSRFNEYRVQF